MGAPIKMKASAAERAGFSYRFCGGGARPGRGIAVPRGANNFLEFYVVDSDEDPTPDKIDGLLAVGQLTLKDMRTDPEVYIYAADALQVATITEEAKVIAAENESLKAQLAALQAKIDAATVAPSTDGETDKSKSKGK